ncbi:MAG: serine/threonine-protein phosphatase, partial [Proteobacteria bacterium]|nr:serine/threonine-protein phosphatase [Pseudomonadota bacterium]
TVDLEQRYHDALREMVGKLVRNNFRSAPPAEESTLFGAPPDADPLIWSEQLHVSYEMRELLDDLISGRTATLDLAQEAIDAFGPGHIIRKRTGWGTHRGRVREGNEDALMLLQQAVVAGNRPLRVELYAVADGMGGHEAGEIASEITLKSMAVELVGGLNITSARDLGRDILDQEFLVDRMTEAIDQTNQTLRKYSWDAHSKSRRKPGSTLVCALALDAIMIIGHVGDSRAYKIELDGSLKRITRDHSPVQMLVDAGRITHEQAFNHPHRHQISSNIGIAPDMLKRDVNVRMLRTGESILLCSDGLCDMMLDDDLEEICKQERDPRRLARTLVETACELGGHDNVTVLVVTRAPGPPQEERESPAKTN